MQLRPYQNDLVEQVRQAWRDGYKAPCIVLGCGGGKSCIVAEIARRTTWNGKRVLFLVHRRELVDQIFRTFVRWGVLMDLCQIGTADLPGGDVALSPAQIGRASCRERV